jgi:hypothetical protein
MYHIAVEARLSGPEASKPAAQQMIADYAVNEPESLRRNEAHICLVNALKKIIMYGSEGVAGATISTGNVKGTTVRASDVLTKEMLRPLAQRARSILDATGCTLDVLITQVMGQGPYTVDKVIVYKICPKQPKGFHVLTQKVINVPTLGLEG